MFFWNSLAFSMIQRMLAIWSLVPLPFLKPAWTSEVQVHVLLKPSLENFEHYFTSMWDECNFAVVLGILCHCLSLGLEWKLTFSRPVATAEFSKFAGILSAALNMCTLSASSFRIWNSSAGILSPLLALFIVMLPKVHLTSHSRMSGSSHLWSHHHGYPGHDRPFLYSSFLYSCHFFLISSASVRSLSFLFSIVAIFAWNVPLYL